MKALLSLIPALFFSTALLLNPTAAKAQHLQLPLTIERYMSTASEIDVSSYIKNIEQYVGFRLVAIEVIASALNESAEMTLHINGTRQGPILELGQVILNYRVVPNSNFLVGQGAEQIKLITTKPAYVKNVNVILTR